MLISKRFVKLGLLLLLALVLVAGWGWYSLNQYLDAPLEAEVLAGHIPPASAARRILDAFGLADCGDSEC